MTLFLDSFPLMIYTIGVMTVKPSFRHSITFHIKIKKLKNFLNNIYTIRHERKGLITGTVHVKYAVSTKFIGPAGQICDRSDLPHLQLD